MSVGTFVEDVRARVGTLVEDVRAIFAALAAPTPREEQHWRLAELPFEKNGEFLGRHVVFVSGTFPRERLDSVCPGRWSVSFTIIAERRDKTGILERVVVKCTLTVLDVTREAIGSGKDEKAAETDSFKRAGRHYGMGSDLYKFDKLYVPMDGPSRHAKPKVDPGTLYWRQQARKGATTSGRDNQVPLPRVSAAEPTAGPDDVAPPARATSSPPPPPKSQGVSYADLPCPRCGGRMWDNRLTKIKNQPDYKCIRSKNGCSGAVWLTDKEATADVPSEPDSDGFPPALVDSEDDLPF